jgi:N-acetylglucosaminyldiphosphoundecaprenol N-acetyl-beta-D-mannosaminyltransferase
MIEVTPRISILGVHVTPLTMARAADIVAAAIRSRRKMRGVFCTTHMIIESQDIPALCEAVNGSDIVATDGVPLVWLSRLRGARDIERVYGPDALLAFCERGLEQGWRHYFYGSTPQTLDKLVTRLAERFPGLLIAGSYSPPFRPLTEDERQDIILKLNTAAPDIIWVGLGLPKQELWAAEYKGHLDAPVILAVGAAFDFHAGTVKQAPRWVQNLGMEWFFRLLQEPQRLWRRYLICNTRFLWLLFRELVTTGWKSNSTSAG